MMRTVLMISIFLTASGIALASDIDRAFEASRSGRSSGDFSVDPGLHEMVDSGYDRAVERTKARNRELRQAASAAADSSTDTGSRSGNNGSRSAVKIRETPRETAARPSLKRVALIQFGPHESHYEATCSNGATRQLIRRKDGAWYYSYMGRNLVTGAGDSPEAVAGYVCANK